MNNRIQAAASPSQITLGIIAKLAIFGLSSLAGWTVALILHETITWVRNPMSHGTWVLGGAFQRLIDCILNALYR